MEMNKDLYTVEDLREIMKILRSEGGCPWDREQTHASIRRDLIEETYEVVEGIDKNDNSILCEELGDLLLQVVFHARIGEEEGAFDLNKIADGVCRKMILRHPHVFGDVTVNSTEDVLRNWDAIKQNEKNQKNPFEVLDSVSHSLPALMRAAKISSKSAKMGISSSDIVSDMNDMETLVGKLLAVTANHGSAENAETVIGQLLYRTAAAAKKLGIDPEKALSDACDSAVLLAK